MWAEPKQIGPAHFYSAAIPGLVQCDGIPRTSRRIVLRAARSVEVRSGAQRGSPYIAVVGAGEELDGERAEENLLSRAATDARYRDARRAICSAI